MTERERETERNREKLAEIKTKLVFLYKTACSLCLLTYSTNASQHSIEVDMKLA